MKLKKGVWYSPKHETVIVVGGDEMYFALWASYLWSKDGYQQQDMFFDEPVIDDEYAIFLGEA